jgi:hypothetical protein
MPNHDKILEALSGLIPENAQSKVNSVITATLDEAVAELDKEYNAKLEEAYKTVTAERENDWKVAEQGYQQAYEIITDLRNRLDLQKEEFEQTTEEEYKKAYDMLVEERKKNETLAETLQAEYEKRHAEEMMELIDNIDQFLAKQGNEYYEMARQDVLNDPYLVEHRVGFEKVIDVVQDYLSEENVMLKTNTKVEELNRQLEQTKNQMRILESRNMKLMTENTKMSNYVRQTKELVEEGMITEQKERLEKGKNVEGRGFVTNEPERELKVISETVDRTATVKTDDEQPTLLESWAILAGVNNKK